MERNSFDIICSYFKPRTYAKNEILLSEGQICETNYFVNEGCLRFFSLNKDGTELTRYFAFPGKFGTALSSLIDQKPSFEYIESIENTVVLEISRKDFFDLVERFPAVNYL
ncbi:Crp/Fnr family transcriptional regulator [[Muricauda] lutisoli]|uniref:Cyclic nucleotide-binding domain-containing protein n=1 Tax=[Muricauda] lutisoli TaxID=2816035 RepID=A0ABS3EY03_9FLAO|nr:cyclic nucleotide-binding domain-containing protein [[Muricauda] lutisoli]